MLLSEGLFCAFGFLIADCYGLKKLACPLFPLVSLVDFPDLFQELLVGNKASIAGHDSFEPDDPLLVDNKVRPLGAVALFFIENTVGLFNFMPPEVAEQRIVQFQRVGKGLLRETYIGADAQHFCIELLKLSVVVPTGR